MASYSDINSKNGDSFDNFARKYRPPAPPGEKDIWELQFCRFWGWNWVQKEKKTQEIVSKCDPVCTFDQKRQRYDFVIYYHPS